MKKCLLVICLTLVIIEINAQLNLEWAVNSAIAPGVLAVDNSGNIYSAGTRTSTGFGYLQKMNSSGVVQWYASYDAALSITSIVLDASGNIFISGSFSGTLDFDPGSGSVWRTSSGNSDTFYQKFNNNGTHAWTQISGTASGYETGWNLAIDNVGNLIAAGGTGTSTSVMKIDPSNGSMTWNLMMNTNITVVDVDTDASGNIFAMGSFISAVDFDPNPSLTYSITTAGAQDIFLMKIASAGTFQWARSFGTGNDDFPFSIVVDKINSQIILFGKGWPYGNPVYKSSTTSATLASWTTGNAVNPFYVVWDMNGNFQSGKNIDTFSETCSIDNAAVTPAGNIVMIYHSSDMGPPNGYHTYYTFCPVTANPSPPYFYRQNFGISANNMVVDNNNFIYLLGNYSATYTDLDPGWRTAMLPASTESGFISKLNQKLSQDITFASIAGKTMSDPPFALSATASSGLPVTYTSSNPAVATISGNTVTIVGLGITTITANQAGNSTYDGAEPATQPLSVCISCSLTQNRLWGVTSGGGANGAGVIFHTNSDGTGYAIDYSFSSGTSPFTGLTQAANGKLYGVTGVGGVNGNGVLFEFDPATNTFLTKVNFLAGSTGDSPRGELTLAPNGKLYGTTFQGGSNSKGVLFEFDPATGTFAKKIDFNGTGNGASPVGGMVLHTNGKLYGFTQTGGSTNIGTLYEYNPSSGTLNKLAEEFYGGTFPVGKPVLAPNGKLYGVTTASTTPSYYYATLFEYDFASGGVTTYGAKLYRVTSGASYTTAGPSGLVQGSNGRIYGTTVFGTTTSNPGYLIEFDPVTPISSDQYQNFNKRVDFNANGTDFPGVGGLFQAMNQKIYGYANSKIFQFSLIPTQTPAFTSWQYFGGAGANSPIGSLIQEKAVQNITLSSISKNYGDAAFTLPATASSGLPITYLSSDPSVAAISGNTVSIIGVGIATITASQAGNQIFLPAVTVQQTLTVNKAPLTVTADPQSKIFGATNPQLTMTYSGFVNGENASVLTALPNTAPTASTSAITCSAVGSYAITPGGGTNNHYSFNYVSSTLTITKASITAQADSKSKIYGSVNPAVTITYTGLVCGDGAIDTPPVFSMTAGQWSDVGSYGINLVAGGSDNNYNFSAYYNSTLSITPASQWMTSFSGIQSQFCGTGASFGLSATASSGLSPVFWSSNSGVVSVSGSTATVVGQGSATIYASQPGNSNFYGSDTWGQNVSVGINGGSISTSGTTNICHTGSVWLTAGAGSGYSWSTGESSQAILATEPGNYSVSYTNSSGCPASASRTVTRTGSGCTNNRMASDNFNADSTFIDDNPNGLFGISPNPTSKEVVVRLSTVAASDSPVSFTDMLGRDRKHAVIEKGQQEKKIPITDLEPGSYIVNIRDGKRYRQRILIITN